MSASLAQAAGSLVRGDHACLSYTSEDEREGALLPFVHAGLRASEKVVCVAAEDDGSRLESEIAGGGTDVSGALASGQLVLRGADETYLPDGAFDTDRMLAQLRSQAASARAEGFDGMRMAGEMEWALSSHTNLALLYDFESRVDDVLRETSITALCQYDGRRFAPDVMRWVEWSHPLVLGHTRGADLISLTALRVERGPRGALVVRGEVDFANCDSLARSLLAEVARRAYVRLDLSGVDFVDGAALRAIRSAARQAHERGGQLVLVSPSPFVVALIAILGLGPELPIELP